MTNLLPLLSSFVTREIIIKNESAFLNVCYLELAATWMLVNAPNAVTELFEATLNTVDWSSNNETLLILLA